MKRLLMTPAAPAKVGIIPRVEKSHFCGVSLSFLHSLESSEGFQCGLFGCSILVRVRFDCIGLQEWMDEKMVLLLISLALVVMVLQCSASNWKEKCNGGEGSRWGYLI